MITFDYNNDLQILEVQYIGEIHLKDMMDYGEMIRNSEVLPRNLKILTDATKAEYKFTVAELKIVLQAMEEQIKPYNSVKTAVIQQKPRETAISFLVDGNEPIQNYQHKVFSTRKAALHWLLL